LFGASVPCQDGGPSSRKAVDIEGNLQASPPLLRVCAWCDRIQLGDVWLVGALARLLALLGLRASHTICPRCFARHARGVRYPAALK
jgi:hypothetical protein